MWIGEAKMALPMMLGSALARIIINQIRKKRWCRHGSWSSGPALTNRDYCKLYRTSTSRLVTREQADVCSCTAMYLSSSPTASRLSFCTLLAKLKFPLTARHVASESETARCYLWVVASRFLALTAATYSSLIAVPVHKVCYGTMHMHTSDHVFRAPSVARPVCWTPNGKAHGPRTSTWSSEDHVRLLAPLSSRTKDRAR
jgi:hypothetical protein